MQTIWKLFISSVFTVHLFLGAAWWWLMPGGFGITHPRFWINRVLPIAVIAVVAVYLWARRKGRSDVISGLILILAGFWAAASVSGRIVFPVTAQVIWLLPLAGAIALGLGEIRFGSAKSKPGGGVLIGAVMLGAVVGALVVPYAERGDDPDTRPLNVAFDPIASGESDLSANVIRLSDTLRVQPNGAVVSVDCANLHLNIEPLLTFISRSPDRCWTLLAHRRDRVGPTRRVVGVHESASAVQIEYYDDGQSRLFVTNSQIEAVSRLDHPIYSHLNSYCSIMVSGHRKLELEFSPCPGARFEVTTFEYPFGRPARFAYMSADESFKVVEARSAEKGPFHTLESGSLPRGDPLTMTLYNQGIAVCRIVLEDWSAQAATQLSPTAGWGVPVNSVTFSLTGSAPSSPAFISVELAGTGIGRGYDSVGHAAGTYRNRMRLEDLTK